MSTKNANKMLTSIGKGRSETAFVKSYQEEQNPEDLVEEGLGLALSSWAEWDGGKLMRVFASALEDSNFHTEAEAVREMEKNL